MNPAFAKAFYDAVIAASYIEDPQLRQEMMWEIITTNRLTTGTNDPVNPTAAAVEKKLSGETRRH